MSNAFQPAIDEIKSRIVIKEAEIHPLRVTLNELCKLAGIPEEYPNLSTPGSTTATTTALSWKPDQFFNRPLATCVAEYFEAREACGLERPSSVEEIYQSLVRGGFKFEGSTGNEANTIRAIKISLTKNTAQFVKLPDDSFSLKKWYNVRTPRRTNSTPKTDEQVGDTGLEEAAVDSPENTKTDSTEDKIGE